MSNERKPIKLEITNELCPESPSGQPHDAVLIDIINAGFLTIPDMNGRMKSANHIKWVFQVFPQDGSRQSNGQPFYFERDATASMFAGSASTSPSITYQIVTGMRAAPFKNPAEAAQYDVYQLLNKPCRLNIIHKNGFPQLSKDNAPGHRGIEPYTDHNGKFITDEKTWPKPELDYYVPETVEGITRRLTNPDRFKKKEQSQDQAPNQSSTQAYNPANNTSDDETIPF